MLVRVWGRIGGRGQAQVVLERETPTLDAAVIRLVLRRLRRGYTITDWQ
jgi:predicted DNA-binding WGR domain protein